MQDTSVPSDWKRSTLGEVILDKPQYGLTARSSTKINKTVYIRISDITDEGQIKPGDLHYVDLNSAEVSKYGLHENDFLIARSGSVGRVYLHQDLEKPAVFASYLIKFRLDTQKVLPKFVFYWGLTPDFKREIDVRKKIVAQPNINAKDYCRFSLPVPPLQTQRRIVSVLDRASNLEKSREQANQLTGKIIQSVFLKMFGDPVRQGKWSRKKLIEVSQSVESGSTPLRTKPENFDPVEGVPLVKVENLGPSGYIELKENQLRISKSANAKQKRSILREADVLINIVGPPLGKVAYVTKGFEGCNINQAIVMIRPEPAILNSLYLWSLLRFPTFNRMIVDIAVSVRQANINLSEMRALSVPVPPLDLQYRFAAQVRKIEDLKSRQTESTQEINGLFNSLMHKAFRGELKAAKTAA